MASDAIIFIPGIKGTKLVESNRVNYDTIWSAVQSNFETIEDLELSREKKVLSQVLPFISFYKTEQA